MNNLPYIYYTHRDTEIDSLEEFVDQQGLSLVRSMTVAEVLAYTDEQGIRNIDRVWMAYDRYQKKQYQGEYDLGTLSYLAYNTVLALPKDRLFRETLGITGVNQVADVNTFNAFIADRYKTLLTDARFVRAADYTNGAEINSVKQIGANISVWIWSRAFNENQPGQMINVSPFVTSCNTRVDDNGGNFNLELAPIIGRKNASGKWSLAPFHISQDSENYTATAHLNRLVDDQIQRESFLFHQILGNNDLVFVRFEELQVEDDRDQSDFTVPITNLPSKENAVRVYDMIGLVDNSSLDVGADQNSVQINITGRDLSKVLIDDGSYFYPLQFAQNVFINPDEDRRLINRLAIDGSFVLQSAFAFRSVRFSLQFIMNHLANMGVVADDLFASYGDKRTTVYRVEDTEPNSSSQTQRVLSNIRAEVEEEIRQAILQSGTQPTDALVRNVFDQASGFVANAVQQRVLTFNGGALSGYRTHSYLGGGVTANTTPSFLTQYSIYLFARITSKVQGELEGEGDPSVLPTYIFNRLYEYVRSSAGDDVGENLIETPANGIWQIIKLVIDSSVADRRLADSSISQPDGSLINQFWKVCQKPFVEFYTDTYEDLFYFIVRQPPLNRSAIHSFFDDGLALTIENSEVVSEQLSFTDQEVYSFYELKPQGLFAGAGSEVSLAYIPIIYFPQYADIWGTRRLSVVSSYLPYSGIIGEQSDEDSNYLIEQTAEDLKYVIDTNCYLPFTRSGTITLLGDRRIKKGTWIRYAPTNEIFYVTAVDQSYSISMNSIDRLTILTVERGMVERYVFNETLNYFNIVDTEIIKDFIVTSLTGTQENIQRISLEIQRNFAVNQGAFDFFLQRKQFD